MTSSPSPSRPPRPRRAGRSGRADREGATPIASVLAAYLESEGHEEVYLLGAVCACWPDVVGPDVAAHATPKALRGNELVVTADQGGWVTQLAFLADEILTQLERHLGRPVAQRIRVTVTGRAGLE